MLSYQGPRVIDERFSKPSPAKAFRSNALRQYLLAANKSHNSGCPPESSLKESK